MIYVRSALMVPVVRPAIDGLLEMRRPRAAQICDPLNLRISTDNLPSTPGARDSTETRNRQSVDDDGAVSFDGVLIKCISRVFTDDPVPFENDPLCEIVTERDGKTVEEVVREDNDAERTRIPTVRSSSG